MLQLITKMCLAKNKMENNEDDCFDVCCCLLFVIGSAGLSGKEFITTDLFSSLKFRNTQISSTDR